MLVLIATDNLPLGSAIPPYAMQPNNPRSVGYLDVGSYMLTAVGGTSTNYQPVLDEDGWIWTGRGNSSSVPSRRTGYVLLRHPASQIIPNKIWFGWRTLARSEFALSHTYIVDGYNNTSGGNGESIPILDTYPTEIGAEYYTEVCVTLSNGVVIVDTWVDGVRLSQTQMIGGPIIASVATGMVGVIPGVGPFVDSSSSNIYNSSEIISRFKDIYIGNDQHPNPMSGRLGPIHTRSLDVVVDDGSTDWTSSVPDMSLTDTLNTPVVSPTEPWGPSIGIMNSTNPLTLRLQTDVLYTDTQYAGLNVYYLATRVGDTSARMSMSVGMDGVYQSDLTTRLSMHDYTAERYEPIYVGTDSDFRYTHADLSTVKIEMQLQE